MTIDQLSTAAEAPHLSAAGDNGTATAALESLAQRVHRLEDAVASLQDTRGLEDRVVERVSDRIGQHAAPAPRAEAAIMPGAGRRLPAPPAITPAPAPPPQPRTAQPYWLLWDVYAEVRAILGMFIDRRYRVSWAARLILLAAGLVMFVSWLLISGLPLLGGVLDRVIDLVVAFLAYKVLTREANRYRATVPNA